MEEKELQWTLVAIIGIILLLLGFYTLRIGIIFFIGFWLIMISLYFGYKDKQKSFSRKGRKES